MIHSIDILQHRILNDFHAELRQLNIVIGANATGKSSLLEFFTLAAAALNVPLYSALIPGTMRNAVKERADADSISTEFGWTIQFSKPAMPGYWKDIPIKPNTRYIYETKIAWSPATDFIPLSEQLRTAEPYPGHDSPFVLLTSLRGKGMIFDSRQRKLVNFDDIPEPGATPGAMNEIPGAFQKEKQSLLLSRIRFFNEYPEISWIRTLLTSGAYYPGFNVARDSAIRTRFAEVNPNEPLLLFDGSNLGYVILEFLTKSTHRDACNTLRSILKLAYPMFDDIFCETLAGAPPTVAVRTRELGMKRLFDLWDLSDGILRFLCLAVVCLNPSPPPLVLIDEPESGLHPRMMPVVGDLIRILADTTQVIVTTHSPELLSCFGLDDVAVMTRDGNEINWNRPGSRDSLRKLLEPVTGETLGDLLRSGMLESV